MESSFFLVLRLSFIFPLLMSLSSWSKGSRSSLEVCGVNGEEKEKSFFVVIFVGVDWEVS